MGYEWKTEAEREGPTTTPKIPAGRHELQIAKLVFGTKKNGFFTAQDGTRQIMLVFADNQNREAAQMVTLSDKAAWVLAKILEAAGADLAKMQAAGVEPSKFTDEKFATANLVGRKLMADVAYEKGNDGKEYASIIPLRPEGNKQAAKKEPAKELVLDDIPI